MAGGELRLIAAALVLFALIQIHAPQRRQRDELPLRDIRRGRRRERMRREQNEKDHRCQMQANGKRLRFRRGHIGADAFRTPPRKRLFLQGGRML